MPASELVLEYIKALVWPATIIVALLAFRRQIASRIDQLRKAKFPGGELEFAERVEALRKTANEGTPPPDTVAEKPEALEVLDLARANPAAGLAVLRMQLEQAVRKLYESHVPETERGRTGGLSAMARDLARREIVPSETTALLLDVVPLANQAVHGQPVSPLDAAELTMLGLRVLFQLEAID